MLSGLPTPTVDVDSMPWWGYAILMGSLTLFAGLGWTLRLFVKRYVIDTVPKETVTLITQAKDAEIERARTDAAEWRAAFHIKDTAYTELAQSFDDLTDALTASGKLRSEPSREGQSNGRGAQPARRRTQ